MALAVLAMMKFCAADHMVAARFYGEKDFVATLYILRYRYLSPSDMLNGEFVSGLLAECQFLHRSHIFFGVCKLWRATAMSLFNESCFSQHTK